MGLKHVRLCSLSTFNLGTLQHMGSVLGFIILHLASPNRNNAPYHGEKYQCMHSNKSKEAFAIFT